ncbi:MAG: nitrogen fixation NifU-like protein [Hyphomicrobiaceae bacterium]|jgi:nitrogen fixation NifU-like protein
MSDLRELYQEVILDHGRRPRNFGRLEDVTHHAKGDNPLCGDRLEVFLTMKDDVVSDVSFEGQGCAISTASASLMTEALKGKTREYAMELFRGLHGTCTGNAEEAAGVDLGKLAVFEGVQEFPLRVKCATLAWHTMKNAVESKEETVATTE